MKDFTIFLGLTVKHLTGSVLGWSLNVITFIGIFATVQYTFFPAWVWIATILFNIFLAAFLAWRGERLKAMTLEAELQASKNAIPEYVVSDGGIKRYSIRPLIDTSEKKIADLKETINNKPKTSGTSKLTGMLAGLDREIARFSSIGADLGIESNKDKLERLELYHSELLQFESKHLTSLYRVDLSIESNRHDKNIEIEITSDDTHDMVVEDDYETVDIPTTSMPSRFDTSSDMAGFMDRPQRALSVAGKYYLQSDASDNTAVSELAYLNATKPVDIFDSTFYIRSKKNTVKLQIKVHSTKLSQPQILTKHIKLYSATLLQVQNN